MAAEYLLAPLVAAVASPRMVGAAHGPGRRSPGVVASAFSRQRRHGAGPRLLPVFRRLSLGATRAVRPREEPRAGRVLLSRFRAARGAHRGSLAALHEGRGLVRRLPGRGGPSRP